MCLESTTEKRKERKELKRKRPTLKLKKNLKITTESYGLKIYNYYVELQQLEKRSLEYFSFNSLKIIINYECGFG